MNQWHEHRDPDGNVERREKSATNRPSINESPSPATTQRAEPASSKTDWPPRFARSICESRPRHGQHENNGSTKCVSWGFISPETKKTGNPLRQHRPFLGETVAPAAS